MARVPGIIAGIIASVNCSQARNFQAWRIGLTHDVKEGYERRGKPGNFYYWEADSLQDAKKIESFFNERGMKRETSDHLSSRKRTYIYIF